MTDSESERDSDEPSTDERVEALAAEFVERLRRGEHPSVAEYEAENPELAREIREIFPTIATMESFKTPVGELGGSRSVLNSAKPERLGDFRIIREIGRGGMGIVYEAQQESLGRRVAVKVLPKSSMLDAKHLQRFKREARTAGGLHHTNIVPVFGVGRQDDFQYYVMQYIEGVGLDRVLARLRMNASEADGRRLSQIARELLTEESQPSETPTVDTKDAMSPADVSPEAASRPTDSIRNAETKAVENGQVERAERDAGSADSGPSATSSLSCWEAVARLGAEVADALEYAHGKGVLHRDIKPANLIVDTQGVAWVADFGLAKALEQDSVSGTGDILGTPAYMAPEQLGGKTDHRSDVYGLGLTLYELLALRPAFEEADRGLLLKRIAAERPRRPRQIRPEIPRDLETIVLKAIAHDPKRRYQSAAELASDLRCFLEDRPIQARRSGAVERLWRWCRRNPVTAGLSTTVAILLVLVTVTTSIGYARTARALSGERAERRRAEAATAVAVEVLDRIYERFSPKEDVSPGGGADGEAGVDFTSRPALSEGTAAVLEDMLVFYDRLAEQSGSDAAYLQKIALANRRVGDIRHHLGQLEQAQAAYERSLELYEQLGATSSQTPDYLELATVNNELGIVVHRLGKPDAAVESWQTALELLDKLDEEESTAPDVLRQKRRAIRFLARPTGMRRPPLLGPAGAEGRPHGPRRDPPERPPRRRPELRPDRLGPRHPPFESTPPSHGEH